MPPLRPYQRDLVEQVHDALARTEARVMLQLPTGAGKTVIAGAVISRWLMDHPGVRVGWLTHRIELCVQTEARLREDFNLLVESSGLRWETDAPAPSVSGGVHLLQAQTAVRRIGGDRLIWEDYGADDLLVVDEAHHAPALGWERVIREWPGHVLGLTATPWRLPAREGFDHIFDHLICGPQIPELQHSGHLARSRTFTPPLEDRIMGKGENADADYTEASIEESNAPLIMTIKAVRYWQRMARDRSTIVYAVSTRHARNLVEAFSENNIVAAVILSDTPDAERDSVIKCFKAGTIQVLVNVMVATEGFDLPDASCVVITRPTKSLALFLQMVGRGLRPKPHWGDCLLLDLTGNTEMHGVPETKREWSLAPRGEPQDGDPPVVRCLACGFMAHPTYHQCPECGADMGGFCDRCGRFRLWKRWSQEIVCDHCFPDLTAEMEESSRANDAPKATRFAMLTYIPQPNDEAVLLALYHATGGATWRRNDGWATDRPLNQWYGVSVDGAGRVVHLNLHENGVTGEIPVELGTMSYLVSLDLSSNQLSGSIPRTLGQLESLTWMDLSDNLLSGRIPVELGRLRALVWLRLQNNQLDEVIPAELGNLTNLRTLRLVDDSLKGPLISKDG